MSIHFSNFAVEIRNTFSPPETRQSATNMMIIELTTFVKSETLQPIVISDIEKIASQYGTDIQVNALWCNTIVIRSTDMPQFGIHTFLCDLYIYLAKDIRGALYATKEVKINC